MKTPNHREQFLTAVRSMAPDNPFIHAAARLVPDDLLPAVPGVAAFEFTSTLDLLCKSWRFRRPIQRLSKNGKDRGTEIPMHRDSVSNQNHGKDAGTEIPTRRGSVSNQNHGKDAVPCVPN